MGEILNSPPQRAVRNSPSIADELDGPSATDDKLLAIVPLRPGPPPATLACLSRRRPPCRSHHALRVRARGSFPSPDCPPAVGAAAPGSAHREERRVGLLDQDGCSSCFPHSLNRRASACGPGRTPAPQPPPRHGGWKGVAVPGGAGDRSAAGYPQRIQSCGTDAPSLATGYPHVFHKSRCRPDRCWLRALAAGVRAGPAGGGIGRTFYPQPSMPRELTHSET